MKPELNIKQKNFFGYYFSLFIKPGQTFAGLMNDNRRLKFGLLAALIPALGYTFFYIMASQAGGAPSTFKPWLAIPVEKYFYYDIFLSIPALYLSVIASAAIVQLISKLFNTKGTYEDLITVIGFGAGVATWSTMLHDLTDAFLAYIGVIDMKWYEAALNSPTFWRYLLLTLFAIYFIWFLVLFTKGIMKSHNANSFKAFLLALIALAVYQVIFLIFIR